MGSPAARSKALALSTWPYSCSISAVSSSDIEDTSPAVAALAAAGVGDPSVSRAVAARTTDAADGKPGAALAGAYQESVSEWHPNSRRLSVGDLPDNSRWCAMCALDAHHVNDGGGMSSSGHSTTRPAPALDREPVLAAIFAALARVSASDATATSTSAPNASSARAAHRSARSTFARYRYCGRKHLPTRSSPSRAKDLSAHLFHASALAARSAAGADGVSGQWGASRQSGPVTLAWMKALSAATPSARMQSS
mmetsp:Transcript_12537/g.50416  ORF Transcript_12537/g.50416 Transcript_12537/m.50416 type:complete len:253 (+) Transcript_12537:2813-3571(+)